MGPTGVRAIPASLTFLLAFPSPDSSYEKQPQEVSAQRWGWGDRGVRCRGRREGSGAAVGEPAKPEEGALEVPPHSHPGSARDQAASAFHG